MGATCLWPFPGISPASGFHHPISSCLWPSYLPLIRTFETILQLPIWRFSITSAMYIISSKATHSQVSETKTWISLGNRYSTRGNAILTLNLPYSYFLCYRAQNSFYYSMNQIVNSSKVEEYQSVHVFLFSPTLLCDMIKVKECWWWPCSKAYWFKWF